MLDHEEFHHQQYVKDYDAAMNMTDEMHEYLAYKYSASPQSVYWEMATPNYRKYMEKIWMKCQKICLKSMRTLTEVNAFLNKFKEYVTVIE